MVDVSDQFFRSVLDKWRRVFHFVASANWFWHRGVNWISGSLMQCCQITGPGLASGAKTLTSCCCCGESRKTLGGRQETRNLTLAVADGVKAGWRDVIGRYLLTLVVHFHFISFCWTFSSSK